MPSMTTYTPYETFAFFQSLANNGADASTIEKVSTALKQNEFISPATGANAGKFSINALVSLYEQTIKEEKTRGAPRLNGNTINGERSPKRRKLSASPPADSGLGNGELYLVQEIATRLYSTYKEDAIKQIRREEEAYAQLQDQIQELELKTEQSEHATSQNLAATLKPMDADGMPPHSSDEALTSRKGQEAKSEENGGLEAPNDEAHERKTVNVPQVAVPSPSEANVQNSPQARPTVQSDISSTIEIAPTRPPSTQHQVLGPPSQQQQQHPPPQQQTATSPIPDTSRSTTIASQQRPSYGHTPLHSGPQPIPHQQTGSTLPHAAQQRPTVSRQGSHQSLGSPIPQQIPNQHQHPYPIYPHYPQWHSPMPQHYPQHPGYGPPQYYPPPPVPGRHPQTPQQLPFQPYPPNVPVHYSPHGWHAPPYPQHSASAATTPISRPDSRLSVTASGSSTPWRRQKRDPSRLRQGSPSRPERDVSPLSDRDSPDPVLTALRKVSKGMKSQRSKDEENAATPKQPTQAPRRGRPASKTPSAIAPSRSESMASRLSDTLNDTISMQRRSQKIKAEPPTTPIPPPSDTEQQNQQRSSGRRGRPRTDTPASDAPRTGATKRKRETFSPSPSPNLSKVDGATVQHDYVGLFPHDPTLVIVSRNFSRTAQLLLNEITSHKLASIFAKPLSERDAPGYRDHIFRPQDLKSVKAAISKGSRAALAAIENLGSVSSLAENADDSDDEETEARQVRSTVASRHNHETSASTPIQETVKSSGTQPGVIGNGFYLVPKSLELVPPRGIVNSAQLEMELMRMFANAIMFNPLPSTERGLGRSLRLRKNGGDVVDTSQLLGPRRAKGKAGRDFVDDSEMEGDGNDEASNDELDDNASNLNSSGAMSSQSGSTLDGEAEEGAATGGVGWDEAGIIADTREIFEDTVEMVVKWRKLEEERMESVTNLSNVVSHPATTTHTASSGSGHHHHHHDGKIARHGSVAASMSSHVGEEDGESTPAPPLPATATATPTTIGTARKRRKVTEH